MKFMIPFLMAALPAASFAGSLSGGASAIPKTAAVLVPLIPKKGVLSAQIMDVVPKEVRATVKLYLDRKIRQWYSRGDGKGVIFLVDAKTENEARATMETLPLAKEPLMDYEHVPL